MLRRIVCSMLIAAVPAGAQVGRGARLTPDPAYWVGLSVGYVEGLAMTDAASGAAWQFGYTSQIRATAEKTLQRGTTIGVAAGFSNAPLTYTSGSVFGGGCGGRCDATADVSQYTVFLRGGGLGNVLGGFGGLHGLYTLETGVTQFANFRDRSSGAKLAPASGSYDATFGLGGGLAFTLSPTADAYVSEMVDWVLHHQDTSSGPQSSAPHNFTLRGGFRVGF